MKRKTKENGRRDDASKAGFLDDADGLVVRVEGIVGEL